MSDARSSWCFHVPPKPMISIAQSNNLGFHVCCFGLSQVLESSRSPREGPRKASRGPPDPPPGPGPKSLKTHTSGVASHSPAKRRGFPTKASVSCQRACTQEVGPEVSSYPAVFKDAFCLFLVPPSPGGVRGRVRTVMSRRRSMTLGRVRPGSVGKKQF